MTATKRVLQAAGLAAGVVGAIAASAPDTPVGRAARRLNRRLARDVRYAVASAPGLIYRLAGRQPDPNVSDDILADRIRSTIGPLEKRLDVPRVHVIVEDRVAILHGDIPADADARAIEHAIFNVNGIRGVESHLHPGLISGDTRPSQSADRRPASDALKRLLGSARDAGARYPYAAVHAVLCTFSDRIPDRERDHVFAHLPQDVQALAGPANRHGERPRRVKTLVELVAAASAEGGMDATTAPDITRAVVGTLHDLVPEESGDVSAVLPSELRDLWERNLTK